MVFVNSTYIHFELFSPFQCNRLNENEEVWSARTRLLGGKHFHYVIEYIQRVDISSHGINLLFLFS